MKDRNPITRRVTQGAAIAAIYVVLTLIFAPISFGVMQIRVAGMRTILPMFPPAAIPGLFLGCLKANILGGVVVWDVGVGSLATLLGAGGRDLLRRRRGLVLSPAVVANGIIVPLVLKYGYAVDLPLPMMALYVTAGEIVGCYVLGGVLAAALLSRGQIFKGGKSG